MTYLVWAPDGKRIVEMEGKIHPDALVIDEPILPTILGISSLVGSDGDAVAHLTGRTGRPTR